jgi:hypothetical protein
MLWF